MTNERRAGEPDPGTGHDEDWDSQTREQVVDEAREALVHLELVNVVPVEIAARAHENPRPAEEVRFEVKMQYHFGKGSLGNRFRYEIELLDETGVLTAEIAFELQVEYAVDGDYEPTRQAAEYLTRTTGLFGAYPYARELAQSLAARLQQDPVVLGLMPRGATRPRSVSRVVRRGGLASTAQPDPV